ncbi:Alpha-latrocrustotoxin [Dactylellina cionopaga]|nr:Alpha-latrocrustotoxin [Dactylellina cionopaga]
MERIQAQEFGARQLAFESLSWMAFARRPLTILELQYALAATKSTMKFGRSVLPERDWILTVCHGLITVDWPRKPGLPNSPVSNATGIIRATNSTIEYYFQQTWHTWFPEAKDYLTKACILFLEDPSFDYSKLGPSSSREDFNFMLQMDGFYQYAAENWGHHARESSDDPDIDTLVLNLLRNPNLVSASAQVIIGEEDWFMNDDSKDKDIYAANEGDEAMVRLLVEKGANLEAKDNNGMTPLLLAAKKGHEGAVKVLVEKGADLEAEGRVYIKMTPLLLAVANNHQSMVRLLVDMGADLEARDDEYNETPLQWATRTKQKEIMNILVEESEKRALQEQINKERSSGFMPEV